jgi:hypothetical protein
VLPAGLQIEAEVGAATSEVLIYCGYTRNEPDSPDNPLDQKLPGAKGHIGRPAHARTWIVFPAEYLLSIPIDVKAVAMVGTLYLGLPAIVQPTQTHQDDAKLLSAADEQLGINVG